MTHQDSTAGVETWASHSSYLSHRMAVKRKMGGGKTIYYTAYPCSSEERVGERKKRERKPPFRSRPRSGTRAKELAAFHSGAPEPPLGGRTKERTLYFLPRAENTLSGGGGERAPKEGLRTAATIALQGLGREPHSTQSQAGAPRPGAPLALLKGTSAPAALSVPFRPTSHSLPRQRRPPHPGAVVADDHFPPQRVHPPSAPLSSLANPTRTTGAE